MYKLKTFLFLGAAVLLTACGTQTDNEQTTNPTTSAQTNSEQISSVVTSENDSSTKDSSTIEAAITFEVDEEEQPKLEKTLDVKEGTKLLDAMKEEYDIKETGGFIESINGFEQDESKNKWWLYSVNGEDGKVGAAEYQLEDGDQIKWTLNGD